MARRSERSCGSGPQGKDPQSNGSPGENSPEESFSGKSPSGDVQTPMAAAMQSVSRIMACALMMVFPAIVGARLDTYFGTGFITLLGLVLGVVSGITYLLKVVSPVKKP